MSIVETAVTMRVKQHVSWQAIADALGVSTRTLTKRYGLAISKRDWYKRTPADKLIRMRIDQRAK